MSDLSEIIADAGGVEAVQALFEENPTWYQVDDEEWAGVLIGVVSSRDVALLSYLIQLRPSGINARSKWGNAFDHALSSQNTAMAAILYQAGIDKNIITQAVQSRWKNLFSISAHVQFAEFILRICPYRATSPLFHAKTLHMAEMLVERLKENPNVIDNSIDGSTPLTNAILKGRKEVGTFLIREGANPRLVGERKVSSLHAAACVGSIYWVQRLLTLGVPADILNIEGSSPLHTLLGQGGEPEDKFAEEFKYFRESVENYVEIVHLLVSAGCSIYRTNVYGETPLYSVSSHGPRALPIVRALLGLDMEGDTLYRPNRYGKTPLMTFLNDSNDDITGQDLIQFLKLGGTTFLRHLNDTDNQGRTAVMFLANTYRETQNRAIFPLIKILLACGAHPDRVKDIIDDDDIDESLYTPTETETDQIRSRVFRRYGVKLFLDDD